MGRPLSANSCWVLILRPMKQREKVKVRITFFIFMSIIKGRAKKLLIDKLVVQTKSVIFKYKRLLVVAI